VVIGLAVLTSNLPMSPLKERLSRRLDRPLLLTGLDQNWGVFAPVPRRQVIGMEARVRLSDGTIRVWRPPAGGRLLGAYWDHRWRKLVEYEIADANAGLLWRPAALLAAREVETAGARAVAVTLVRRVYQLRPPTARGRLRGPEHVVRYYRVRLRAGRHA
jgi:hypothetical protein